MHASQIPALHLMQDSNDLMPKRIGHARTVNNPGSSEAVFKIPWYFKYYDLFDTLLRNRQIAGDFGNIACDFGDDHNELFKSQVISPIFKQYRIFSIGFP
jgi:hypothetical protein